MPMSNMVIGPTSISGMGHTPVPRFSAFYPNNLIVPAGQTVTLPENFDIDAIEVSGVLKLSRDHDTNGRFINIQVLPGGVLDFGTDSDPVLRKVDLVLKDSPLLTGTDGNLGPDPEQFGNSITVFGDWTACSRKFNKSWFTMQPVESGATTLALTGAPVNWKVGDYLLIPDTRQTAYYKPVEFPTTRVQRRESPVQIAAIFGNLITLSKPLDFEHYDVRRVNGELMTLPFVANITRDIVIRSENLNGVRGHCMFMDMAMVDVCCTAFIGLGRTLAKPIDSFNAATKHIGTNQIARYCFHWHKVMAEVMDALADGQEIVGRVEGCYFDGTNVNKWGVVQHGTHDLLISDNIADRFIGAGFTSAEDGYEIRGHYLGNLACYIPGIGDNGKNGVFNNNPGSEGAGIWGHGSGSEFRGNLSCCCGVGASFVLQKQVEGPSRHRSSSMTSLQLLVGLDSRAGDFQKPGS